MVLDLSREQFARDFNPLPSPPEQAVFRHPDGEHFRIARVVRGTVVTDSGRWIPPEEWRQVERVR